MWPDEQQPLAQLHASISGTSSIADDRRLATAEASWTNNVAFCASVKCDTPAIKDAPHSPVLRKRRETIGRDATLKSKDAFSTRKRLIIHWIVLGKGSLSFIYFKQTARNPSPLLLTVWTAAEGDVMTRTCWLVTSTVSTACHVGVHELLAP